VEFVVSRRDDTNQMEFWLYFGAGTNLKVGHTSGAKRREQKCACVGVGLFDAADISVGSGLVRLT